METINKKKLFWGFAVYTALFLILLWATNLTAINEWFGSLLRIFRPLLIGLVIAYLCNPIFRLFERKLFYRVNPVRFRRGLSLFFSYLLLGLIFVVLALLIIPQLVESIRNFANNADGYFDSALEAWNSTISNINKNLPHKENGAGLLPIFDAQAVKQSFSAWLESVRLDGNWLLTLLTENNNSYQGTAHVAWDLAGKLLSMAGDAVMLIFDVIFGLFISIYLLHTKEKRYAQIMRFRRAFFSDRVNAVITKILTTADRSFGGFLKGKLFDSAIVGVLVYIAISLFGIPYAILIAVTVAITDIVPIIGPFIGVIPSAVVILLTDPPKVIPFLICILIIQQIDGNIIAPKVLGEHTGVSSLCVLISITTMGTLWGLVGMIAGVPLFATVLELTGEFLDKRLKDKGLSTETDDYITPELAGEHNSLSDTPEPEVATPASGRGDLTAAEHETIAAYQAQKSAKKQ